jgi:small subunit ribosomal protein S9
MSIIHTSGKRKSAIARATLKPGSGNVKINNLSIDYYQPKLARLKLREPLILAGPITQKVDISVRVTGGGFMSQAEASRLAIAKALAEHTPKLKDVFLNYDRHLLVADVRRKEEAKPNRHGKARAKRQKSYR